MGKYGELSRKDGHSKYFLQRTLTSHDRSMDHPWMQMIYGQSFSMKQYTAWLACNRAIFERLEQLVDMKVLEPVNDSKLWRTSALDADLKRFLGDAWREEVDRMVADSPATGKYLEHLDGEAGSPPLVLAHHFLQFNAVLSGGAYLGKMVSEKLCLPHGAPGVRFYAFEGVAPGKEAARVQSYLKALDSIELTDEDRDAMLVVMQRIYSDTEALMTEIHKMDPRPGRSYKSNEEFAAPTPVAEKDMLEVTLDELHQYNGDDGGRIIMSIAGELLDITAGAEVYGPGGGYHLLAGRDTTRCLGTMSLEPDELDDLAWQPESVEDASALEQWRKKLKEKYPVTGRLIGGSEPLAFKEEAQQLLKDQPVVAEEPEATASTTPDAEDGNQVCPMSGKKGKPCPMAMFGIAVPKAKAEPKAKGMSKKAAMMGGGKSILASMEEAPKTGSASSGDSLFYRLCPFHWDETTTKAIMWIALAAWGSGVIVGWQLQKLVSTL
uniref:Cytochrome b5 heme-binding domain-containing protein n=1 Tax=Noctiluca scintillans TaxID=2966 RepID=A0A7S1AUZ1_NOCSC|mmetsp:Transcript_61379/g.163231  ORF Transcript_61379/g.163231 Transcript_61379/m.163231 type:complete len:493 (+) Transcript_61379:68-1546(+)